MASPGFVTISALSFLENPHRPEESAGKMKLWAFDAHLNFVDNHYAEGFQGAGALAHLRFYNSSQMVFDPNILTAYFIVARVCHIHLASVPFQVICLQQIARVEHGQSSHNVSLLAANSLLNNLDYSLVGDIITVRPLLHYILQSLIH